MTPPQNSFLWHSGVADSESARLEPISFASLAGFDEDDHLSAWAAFSRTCHAIASSSEVLRPAVAPGLALVAAAKALDSVAAPASGSEARALFEAYFQPYAIVGDGVRDRRDCGFLTGYYEPLVEGSLVPNAHYTAPILARPGDLVSFPPGEIPFPGRPELGAAWRRPDLTLEPYPDRAAIEAGVLVSRTHPVVWLRDAVEVFMIQVQGSAKVHLPDGRWLRLTYAGRNGQPYTSIGRILVEEGHILAAEMSLANLKDWIRAHGQEPGRAGRALMQRNKSYIFFDARECVDPVEGPIGGAGIPLSPLRSIAVDRRIWAYGLPFWIDAEIPWQSTTLSLFRRLMIAQDTGSAILGAARADLYFASGDDAGRLAAGIRHSARMSVLLPKLRGDAA